MARKVQWDQKNIGVLLIGIIISLSVAAVCYRELNESSAKEVKSVSETYAARTESNINVIFHKTDVLAAVVKLQNGKVSLDTFNEVAKLIYDENRGIRGIQYMPGAVVTYSYPIEGNEAVMGKNFFNIPERRKDVDLAIDTKKIALSGPYELIQGGLGVVARNPIFLKDASGHEYFWGFSAIVLDLPQAIEGAALNHLKSDGYDYQLYCINENNERLVIEGNPNLDLSQAVSIDIRVPNHVWTLAIRPWNPWANLAKAIGVFLLGFLLSLLIWLRYSMIRQREAALASRDMFFSDISHDMRTPLNAIIGFSMLAQKPGLPGPSKDGYIRKIEASAALLLDLINDTLTISRANLGKLQIHEEPVSARKLALSIIDPIRVMAQEKHITVNFAVTGYRPDFIMADQLNVQKIFLNLLNNAVKYTPEDRNIWLTIHFEKQPPDRVAVTAKVRDDGIGIGPEFLEHLYEPFAQERRKGYEGMGSGLGLAIVKQIVDLLGGTIQVESKPDHGTTFTVNLFFCEAERPAKDRLSGPEDLSRLVGCKVLICEDNLLNQEIIAELLKDQGLVVDLAENGKIGVEKFAASAAGEYQAILMDLRMPVMDGYEAVTAIRRLNHPDAAVIPIFALTADAFEGDAQKCMDTGMNGCLTKPVDMKKIMEALYQTL